MMKKKLSESLVKIAFVGSTGFPYRFNAQINRIRLLAKGLCDNGCWVLIINRRGYLSDSHIKPSGHVDRVLYVHSSGVAMRPRSFIVRNFLKLVGIYNEIRILRKKNVKTIIINTRSLGSILHYFFWSRIFGIKTILNYTELNSAQPDRKHNSIMKLNDYLFEKYAFRLLDGVVPISDLLISTARNCNPVIPFVKIPVLVDFKEFNVEKETCDPYFIYCGHALYDYIIEFIIKSFELVSDKSIGLKLVLYGKPKQIEAIKRLVSKSSCNHRIEITSGLPYIELIQLYINATGLLIPLKPFLKDIARFPHKIGEYAASGRPIITTAIGEINNYFTNDVNALVAYEYDCEIFAKKMDYAFNNPEQAEVLGINARIVGKKYFDYKANGKKLQQFILTEMR